MCVIEGTESHLCGQSKVSRGSGSKDKKGKNMNEWLLNNHDFLAPTFLCRLVDSFLTFQPQERERRGGNNQSLGVACSFSFSFFFLQMDDVERFGGWMDGQTEIVVALLKRKIKESVMVTVAPYRKERAQFCPIDP